MAHVYLVLALYTVFFQPTYFFRTLPLRLFLGAPAIDKANFLPFANFTHTYFIGIEKSLENIRVRTGKERSRVNVCVKITPRFIIVVHRSNNLLVRLSGSKEISSNFFSPQRTLGFFIELLAELEISLGFPYKKNGSR